MKTNNICRAFALALTLVIGIAYTSAQVVFKKQDINIGNLKTETSMTFKINDMNGVYWECKSGQNQFLLDLSPANPRIAGTGNMIVFYNSRTDKYNSIKVASVLTASDARLKTNIKDLSGGLTDILQLRPVSYNWKTSAEPLKMSSANDSTTHISNSNPDANVTQYGFLAQDVEKIIPDIVETDEGGAKAINYTALIPMLVQSIQELQATISNQNAVIESLSSRVDASALKSATKSDYIISCTPNPTQAEITFTYSLGTESAKAQIIITTLTGHQVHQIDCSGQNSVSTNLSSLNAGIYLATLVVDNNIRDSKQIVVSK